MSHADTGRPSAPTTTAHAIALATFACPNDPDAAAAFVRFLLRKPTPQ